MQITGVLELLGDLSESAAAELTGVPCAMFTVGSGRKVVIAGLTLAECRSLAMFFGAGVDLRAKFAQP